METWRIYAVHAAYSVAWFISPRMHNLRLAVLTCKLAMLSSIIIPVWSFPWNKSTISVMQMINSPFTHQHLWSSLHCRLKSLQLKLSFSISFGAKKIKINYYIVIATATSYRLLHSSQQVTFLSSLLTHWRYTKSPFRCRCGRYRPWGDARQRVINFTKMWRRGRLPNHMGRISCPSLSS